MVGRELEELWLATMTTSVIFLSSATTDVVIRGFKLLRKLSGFSGKVCNYGVGIRRVVNVAPRLVPNTAESSCAFSAGCDCAFL